MIDSLEKGRWLGYFAECCLLNLLVDLIFCFLGVDKLLMLVHVLVLFLFDVSRFTLDLVHGRVSKYKI